MYSLFKKNAWQGRNRRKITQPDNENFVYNSVSLRLGIEKALLASPTLNSILKAPVGI